MAYIYRFKDINNNVIYVGYTGQTLSQRMQQHFTKGHLPKECYKSIASIEYQKYNTKADAQIMEVIYINKYKPKYNKLNKQNDSITISMGEEKEWKTYKILKYPKEAKAPSRLPKVISYIYFLLILLYLVFKLLYN